MEVSERLVSAIFVFITLGKPTVLFRWDIEACIVHTEGFKDLFSKKISELHARNHLDNSTHDVSRCTVHPLFTRGEHKRTLAHFLCEAHSIQKLFALEIFFRLLAPKRTHFLTCGSAVRIRDTGSHGEQVAYCYISVSRTLTVLIKNHRVGELRDKPLEQVTSIEQTTLDKYHCGSGCDRL